MKMMRKAAMPLAATAVLLGLLTGCSAGNDDSALEKEASPTASASAEAVDDASLGAAVQRMVYSGFTTGEEDNTCFAEAAKDAGLSKGAQSFLVKLNSNDWGTAAEKMRAGLADEGAAEADILTGKQFHGLINACADAAAGNAPVSPEVIESENAAEGERQAAEAKAKKDKEAKAQKADTKPKFVVKDTEEITTTKQLEPGLVSMLSSYGDESSQALLKETSTCLTNAVLGAGLSQESLRFIAGGAQLGTGTLSEFLPSEADQKIWDSEEFVSDLSACNR